MTDESMTFDFSSVMFMDNSRKDREWIQQKEKSHGPRVAGRGSRKDRYSGKSAGY
ncbi:hypothetical protein PTKU64_91680 (plasmid) [Paraburkholderia terrae]|uniref:Uncharacterized protein n=1 Tax=Paraburkholderia terrae TaxID=311230 RepID=A0ABN6JX96_9BURK|nr:hypothetical protein PTKU64_91680 [Paraburkholderia terrae]